MACFGWMAWPSRPCGRLARCYLEGLAAHAPLPLPADARASLGRRRARGAGRRAAGRPGVEAADRPLSRRADKRREDGGEAKNEVQPIQTDRAAPWYPAAFFCWPSRRSTLQARRRPSRAPLHSPRSVSRSGPSPIQRRPTSGSSPSAPCCSPTPAYRRITNASCQSCHDISTNGATGSRFDQTPDGAPLHPNTPTVLQRGPELPARLAGRRPAR